MVQPHNGAIANTARFNRKSFFKDGGRQTGSTYVAILSGSNDISTSGLKAAILKYRLPVTSDSNRNSAIEFLEPKISI